VSQVEYLRSYISTLLEDGITVDFTTDDDFAELGVQRVDLTGKLVIGLISAGGVGGPITAANASKAYSDIKRAGGENVNGFMYWCIGDDSDGSLPAILSEAMWG